MLDINSFSLLAFFIAITKKDKRILYADIIKGKIKGKRIILIEPIMNFIVLAYIPVIMILPQIDPSIELRFYKVLPILLCLITIVLMGKGLIKSHRIITSFCFLIIGVIGYHSSAIAWKSAETETCSKTYGLYRFFDSGFRETDSIKLKTLLGIKKGNQ